MEFPVAKGITVTSLVGKNSPAFTLIELVLVLLVLAISSLIVIPNIEKGMQDRSVRGSALSLAAVARDLRSRALNEGLPQQLVIDPTQGSYRVARDNEVQLPPDVKFSQIGGGETLNGGVRTFYFFPNGSNLGGEIILSSVRTAISYAIRLEALTGKIEVSRGDKP